MCRRTVGDDAFYLGLVSKCRGTPTSLPPEAKLLLAHCSGLGVEPSASAPHGGGRAQAETSAGAPAHAALLAIQSAAADNTLREMRKNDSAEVA